jgi:starch phosphorylase
MHEKVSRRIFGPLWNGYSTEELNLGHVTNGVHLLSWLATEWQALYLNTFGEKFFELNSEENNWKKINEIPDKTIWEIHLKLKNKLFTR